MSELPEFLHLSDEVKEALAARIRALPIDFFSQRAASSLVKGFRVSQKTLPTLRQRLIDQLDHPQSFSENTVRLLRSAALTTQFIVPISEEVLTDRDGFNVLCQAFGGANLVAAMLFDTRDAVREKAKEAMLAGNLPAQVEGKKRLEALKKILDPFIAFFSKEVVRPWVDAKKAETAEEGTEAEDGELDEALKQTGDEKFRAKIRTLQRRLETAEKERREALTAQRTAEDALKKAEKARDAAETRVQELQGTLMETERKLDAALRDAEHTRKLAAEEEQRHNAVKEDLLAQISRARAENAAQKQAMTGFASLAGVERLRNDRDRYRKAYEALRSALDALAGIPQEMPDPEAEIVPPAPVEMPPDADVAEAEEENFESLLSTHLPLKRTERDPLQLLTALSGVSLRDDARILFLIDGHNFVNTRPDYVERIPKMSHEDLRKHFQRELRALADACPQCEIHLVWDGSAISDQNFGPRFKISYSGGLGEHRADRRITKYLSYLEQRPSGEKVFVVTADIELRNDSARHGAALLYPDDLAELLSATRPEP